MRMPAVELPWPAASRGAAFDRNVKALQPALALQAAARSAALPVRAQSNSWKDPLQWYCWRDADGILCQQGGSPEG